MNANIRSGANTDQFAMVKQVFMEPGERLQDALSAALAHKGEVVDFQLTPKAGYAAVKTAGGQVEAFVLPYAVDFHQPAPRAIQFGIQSERDNPRLALAPQTLIEQLSPALDSGASAWRQRCWANFVGHQAALSVMKPGDVIMLAREIAGNHGPLRPDYYAVRASDRGFTVIEALRTGKSSLVHNLAADAVNVNLDPDPMLRLSQHPSIVKFGLQRVAHNDEQEHYLLVGRTASGLPVPLAKATGVEERDYMLQRVWEISKLRQESLRSLNDSPVFSYMAKQNLIDAVVEQAKGEEPVLLQDLQIEIVPLAPEYALDGPAI